MEYHDEKIQALENKENTTQLLLEAILKEIKNNNTQFHDRLDSLETKNTEAFIQIYQRDLIVDGKSYLANKMWTPQ